MVGSLLRERVMGCEAIERGANSLQPSTRIIVARKQLNRTLKHLKFSKESSQIDVIRKILNWLKKIVQNIFDFIYFDPPYESKLYSKILPLLTDNSWLSPGGY